MKKHPQFLRIAAGLVAVIFLNGCALLGKKRTPVPEATLPIWVGRIIMVDTVHHFALVDTGASRRMEAGVPLLSFRDQRRTASLVATAESRPPYVAVEITDGFPSVDDQVALDESHPPPATAELMPSKNKSP